MKITALALILGALATTSAMADEQAITLKPGPSKDVVENNCGSCHSLDYIQMNSPFMSAKTWEAEVNKMIKAFGAPIEEADAKKITEYLIATYGGS